MVREIENVELLESAFQGEGCPDEFFTMRPTADCPGVKMNNPAIQIAPVILRGLL